MMNIKNQFNFEEVVNNGFSYKDLLLEGLDLSLLKKFLYSMSLIRACEYKIAEEKK